MKLITYDDVLDYKLQARFFLGRAILSLFFVLGVHSQLSAADGTWTNIAVGTTAGWWTASAWSNSIVADGAGSTATITVNQTRSPLKIVLTNTATTTIGVLNIGATNGYTLGGATGSSLTFDNNNANAQLNVISGSATVILESTLQSIVLNDSLVISQSSSLTLATATKGGSGIDVKTIEHGGSGTGGVTISGVIANGDAGTGLVAVRQNNSNGTMTLSGANTYTGGTTVDAGTLALGGSGRLSDTGALTINGGTFDMKTFSDTVGVVTVNGGSLINGSSTGLTGSSYAVTGGTISAVLAGTGRTLTKTGTGTTVLSGANSYNGGTFLNGGVLSVSSKANFGTGFLTFDGGTLETTASFSDLTSANNTTLNAGGGTIRIGAGLTNSWGSAAIGGTGGLTKDGNGVLILAANNTYTGGTVIKGGVISVSSSARINANNGGLTFDGGTLLNTANLGFTKSTTLLAGGGTFDVAAGTTNIWNAPISGDGRLIKAGAGQLTLTATNVYTNSTSVEEGKLAVYGALSGSLAFSNGTTLILRTTNSTPSSVGGSLTFPSNCVLDFENTNGLTGVEPVALITATSISGSPSLASSLTNSYVLTNTGTALLVYIAGSTTPDTTKPVITLVGLSTVNVDYGAIYTDQGATVTDNKDATRSISGTGTVNTLVPASYTITFNADDAAGNIATTVTRTVVVGSAYALYLSINSLPTDTAFDAKVDGVTVGLRYAFNSANGMPQNNGVTAVPVMIGDQLTYTFDVKDDSALTITYQTSIDLLTWTTPQGVSLGTGSTPAGFLKKQVQVTGLGRLFVRIKVTHP